MLQLVTVNTFDGVTIDGAWYPSSGSKIGVLLIHGRAQNFYTSVVRWLSPYLSELGFSSLALNMRDHDHLEIDGIPGAVHDIDAGIRFLEDQGIHQYILVGVSYGSNKAALFLSEVKKQEDLLGVVLLATGGIKTYIPELWAEVLQRLSNSPFPLLVIQAGSDEHVPDPHIAGKEVTEAASKSAKANLVVIEGANHGFSNHQKEVYREINNWLRENNWLS